MRSLHPYFRFAALVGILIWGGSAPGDSTQSGRSGSISAASPASFLQWLEFHPHRSVPTWIFFLDKGWKSSDDVRLQVERLRESRKRRLPRRPRLAVCDERDLPVCADYVAHVRDSGLRIRQVSRWLNAVSVEGSGRDLSKVAAWPEVLRIQPVARTRSELPPPRPELSSRALRSPDAPIPASGARDEACFYGASFNQLDQIGIVGLHRRGYTGAGVKVAIFDGGFRLDHPALAGRRIYAQRDFVHHDDQVYDNLRDSPYAWEHGTATLSNLGGYAPGALIGGAYEADFIVAVTEDIRAEYPGEEDNFVAALEWADSLGADVVSASIGYTIFDGDVGYTPREMDGKTALASVAIDLAVARGMAVVNAAGNEGPDHGTIGAPADAFLVIGVGAVDSTGTLAGFSSRGPSADGRTKPEVLARGLYNFVAASGSNRYGTMSGTSLSTPIVAGAAALLLEAHPDWDGRRVREVMMATASEGGEPGNDRGWGLVRAEAAFDFEPPQAPRVSGPFYLVTPVAGAIVPANAAVFSWRRSVAPAGEPPVQYTVLLSTSADLSQPLTIEAGTDTFVVVAPGVLSVGPTWHWSVRARNGAGRIREPYCPYYFRLQAATDLQRTATALSLAVFPNPGRPAFTIRCEGLAAGASQPRPAPTDLIVFDVHGRLIRRLEPLTSVSTEPGFSTVWDGRDSEGRPAPDGVYFLQLSGTGYRLVRKLTLVR